MLDLVINEPKPEDIPSKLRPLMKAFQSAPFHVAPEREKELLVLRDKYDIRIYLKGDAENWLFEERRMLKKIFIGLRTLERLWAYCYGYNAIVSELQKADGDGQAVANQPEFRLGFQLLEWASQKELRDIEGGWPHSLPDPSDSEQLEHVRAANHIFLVMSGRLLLHEFAHTVLEHGTKPGVTSEVLKSEEIEADKWADDWMLQRWTDYKRDEKVFIGRCLGIACAHVPTLVLGLDAKIVSPSHPSPIERILSFVSRHLGVGNPLDRRPIDFPAAFLVTVASQLVFMKHKVLLFEPVPSTYEKWFRRFERYFP